MKLGNHKGWASWLAYILNLRDIWFEALLLSCGVRSSAEMRREVIINRLPARCHYPEPPAPSPSSVMCPDLMMLNLEIVFRVTKLILQIN